MIGCSMYRCGEFMGELDANRAACCVLMLRRLRYPGASVDVRSLPLF